MVIFDHIHIFVCTYYLARGLQTQICCHPGENDDKLPESFCFLGSSCCWCCCFSGKYTAWRYVHSFNCSVNRLWFVVYLLWLTHQVPALSPWQVKLSGVRKCLALGTGHKVCVREGDPPPPIKASENNNTPPSKEMKCFVPPPRTQPITLSPKTKNIKF